MNYVMQQMKVQKICLKFYNLFLIVTHSEKKIDKIEKKNYKIALMRICSKLTTPISMTLQHHRGRGNNRQHLNVCLKAKGEILKILFNCLEIAYVTWLSFIF